MVAELARRSSFALALLLVVAGGVGCGDDMITPPPPGTDSGTGPIDVDGGSMLPDTGIGTSAVSITRLVPDHGAFTGGTTVIVRGTGFTEDAEVTIDGRAVQPADIELIDSNRLSIVTPAGEVGPADVVVTVGDDTATLEAGYTYDAFYVDPNRGAVSGGTLVNIIGSGTAFADGDEVVFGRTPCNEVTVVSETTITCRTPPMAAGSVDVTILRASDASELVLSDGYTYYDSTDPFGGGLGGGPIAGTLNVTVLNAGNGAPVDEAFVIVGEDVATPYQGLTDLNGQITFSGDDLLGPVMVTAAKFCFEKTSIVSFDATDVTIFLVPWMDPMCGMGGMPPTGRGRNGAFISGELVWPSDFGLGPQPWFNVPNPRAGEVKVAYVYTTQAALEYPNPDPSLGGAIQRVLETGETGDSGYLYRIFARPAGLAVYALAGLENTTTGEFIPYVTGIARNVLAGPGEEVEDVDIVMDIPLDHTLDVAVTGLPAEARTGPDRFKIEAYMDLGGEGVIVREVNLQPLDIVRGRNNDRPFRFWAQPALFGALADGRYRIIGGWYTGDFDAQPYTVVVQNGVRAFDATVTLDGFLGIPQATSPAYGERLPSDRILRWAADGPTPDMHIVLMIGGDGNPAWRHFVRGDVYEAPIPDLSTIEGIDDISAGFITWVVYAVKIPGFDFDEFSYTYLQDRFWSHYAIDYFTATR
jgi:hypothetical protein